MVWGLSPKIIDTAQTQNRDGACFGRPAGDPNEYFHPNSVDLCKFNDTVLVAVSERHTSLIRIWLLTVQDTIEYELIGSTNNQFSSVHALGDSMFVDAQHDFRFIRKEGDRILCSLFSDGVSCGATTPSAGLLFYYYPKIHSVEFLRKTGFNFITSAMGSYRFYPEENISVLCHGVGTGRKDSTGKPMGFWPLKEGGQLSIVKDDVLVAALTYTNIFNWNSTSSGITIAASYRSTLVAERNLPINQPKIECVVTSQGVTLSTGMRQVLWNTGDTTQFVLNVPDGRYIAKGVTDTSMLGKVYSQPIWVYGNACHSSPKVTTHVESVPSSHVLVYPNPTHTLFRVDSEQGYRSIKVTTMLGELIVETDVEADFECIDLSKFPAGVYLVTVTFFNGTQSTMKVLKV